MKHTFMIDANKDSIQHSIDGLDYPATTLGSFLSKLAPKMINFGLLPPVVKLITPVFHNNVAVIVENKPCKHNIMYCDVAYHLTIPWHSFILYFECSSSKLFLTDACLYFHGQEILSLDDLNDKFLCLPYTPNTYTFFNYNMFDSFEGNLCLGKREEFSGWFESDHFIDCYYDLMNLFWSTAFNDELSGCLSYYFDTWYNSDYCGLKTKCGILSDDYTSGSHTVLDHASTFSFSDAIGSLVPMYKLRADGHEDSECTTLFDSTYLNPSFTLTQLLG